MFKFHCDRCDKFIKDVSGSEAKEIMIANDMVCKDCLGKEDSYNKMAERIKRKVDTRINQVIAEVKAEIQAGLKDI